MITEDSRLMTETPISRARPFLTEINSLIQIRNNAEYIGFITIKNQVLRKTMHFHSLPMIIFSLKILSLMLTTDLFRLYTDCIFCNEIKSKIWENRNLHFYISRNCQHFNHNISVHTKSPINDASERNLYIYVCFDCFIENNVTVKNAQEDSSSCKHNFSQLNILNLIFPEI